MKVKKFKERELIVFGICVLLFILAIISFRKRGIFSLPILAILFYLYWNRRKLVKKIKKVKKNIGAVKQENTMNVNKKKKKIKKNNKGKNKNLFKKVIFILVAIGTVTLLGVICLFCYIVISTSTFNPEALNSKEQTIVYDINNEVIATLGREKRENVKYDDLPQVLIDAIVATEDSRFFQHSGIDLPRFIKASSGQVLKKLRLKSSNPGGASTLTMQVVKNNLTSRDQTVLRKFKDIYLSVFFLEKKYTKEEILEFYVNDSLLGGNVYGVGEASEYYFGKSVSELSLPEAALIAGLFQSPNADNPYKNVDNAEKRRNTVLKLMVRHGYITKEESNFANSIPVESLLVNKETNTNYQGYIDTVVDEIIDKTGDDPGTVPMKIYTSMDRNIQDGLNAVLNGEVYTWENDVIQSGISVINVKTGAIAALGSGRNRQGEKLFNYATMAKRQPGSTAKPVFDYGPAIEYNNYSTYNLFMDEPWTYSDGKSINNWDGGYFGLITMKRALAASRNIPALKAFQNTKKSNITEFAEKLGINVTKDVNGKKVNYLNEAYAIGGLSEGVSPLQMAAAYATFASGGYYTEPYSVIKIEYRETGETKELVPKKELVIKPSTAFLINDILEYAVNSGSDGGAKISGSHVAAKTGTSNFDEQTLKNKNIPSYAVNDLWTVAYTSEYSVALWYGYDTASSEYFSTNNSPKNKVMAAVMKYIPKDTVGFSVPNDVVKVDVEFGTWPAKLPSSYTPSDLITSEYFIKGTQPTEISERFNKLEDVKNVKATENGNTLKLSWSDAEPEIIKESYLNKYFSQSVFGNSTNDLISERKNYNSSILGDFGYGIYEKTASGIKEVAFTTKTEYNYTMSNSSVTEIIIKAEYKKFKSNASDGTSVKIDTSKIVSDLIIEFENNSIEVNKGKITVNDLKDYKITQGGKNVTSILKTVKFNLGDDEYLDIYSLLKDMNKLDEGTYKLKYTVIYKNTTASKIKTIIIK